MKLIKEEKLNLRLKGKEFNWSFEVEKEGIYGIEILSSSKSWWQNFLKSFLRDDELSVKIDGISFSKKSVAWSGNNLKGLKKTNFFIIYLSSGIHNLNFLVDQSPLLESIRIYQIEESEISFLPRDNYPIQDGNRRQWLTIVLVNLPIKALKIEASAEEGNKFFAFKRDDSDLKLIIDGEIQKNEEPKSHRNWYWCGRVLKGKEKIFERELNLKPKIHYIELWADRSPKIKGIKIKLEKPLFFLKAKVIWERANLREKPLINENILAEILKEEKVIILEKAIKGERPFYRPNEPAISDRWHKVSYKGKVGFVYCEALEIEGEGKEEIKKKIREKAEELGVDSKLMLSLAYCESQFFPYAVSEKEAKGIFQLMDDAIEDINERYGGNITDPFDADQNIDGGIRYFKEILAKYKGSENWMEKSIVAWSLGPERVPKEGPFRIEDYQNSPRTLRLLRCTLDFYEKEVSLSSEISHKENSVGKAKLSFLIILMLFISIATAGVFLRHFNLERKVVQKITKDEVWPIMEKAWEENKIVKLGNIVDDLDSDGKLEKINFSFYVTPTTEHKTLVQIESTSPLELEGAFNEAFVVDINKDGKKELIIELVVGANGINSLIYSYKKNRLEYIPIVPEEKIKGFLNNSGIKLGDYDDDGELEVWIDYSSYPSDPCKLKRDIYEFLNGKLIKTKDIETFEENCRKVMEEFKG